jgi:tRNA-2-methylthio-N6-dimethylallyladenosine synthase
MTKKIYVQTYGCQMNQYDTERILRVMARCGYEQTDSIDSADLIVLNTCSVREKAEQKVYSALGSWREFKQDRDGVVHHATGRRKSAQTCAAPRPGIRHTQHSKVARSG